MCSRVSIGSAQNPIAMSLIPYCCLPWILASWILVNSSPGAKWPPLHSRSFQMHFRECKVLHFDSKLTEFCSQGPNWQQPSIGLDNGLAPNRRQAIIWANADPIYWHIYAALGGDDPILGQVMACRLFVAKPLPEPLPTYCQLHLWAQISDKFESKHNASYSKCSFENFVCTMSIIDYVSSLIYMNSLRRVSVIFLILRMKIHF